MTTNDELSDMLTTIRANYVAGLERQLAEQQAAMERAREELEAVEWFPLFVDNGGYGDHWEDTCMRCYNTKDEGHAADCPREAALAALRGLQMR